jgi:hypothetical protein
LQFDLFIFIFELKKTAAVHPTDAVSLNMKGCDVYECSPIKAAPAILIKPCDSNRVLSSIRASSLLPQHFQNAAFKNSQGKRSQRILPFTLTNVSSANFIAGTLLYPFWEGVR